jgi:hypothetical protein
MPVTNPWLAGPAPTRRLDRERLEERILNLLSSQNMCVLATTGTDGPLATPVRYFHLDFALMFTAAPDSPKMRNLARDPRVSDPRAVGYRSSELLGGCDATVSRLDSFGSATRRRRGPGTSTNV